MFLCSNTFKTILIVQLTFLNVNYWKNNPKFLRVPPFVYHQWYAYHRLKNTSLKTAARQVTLLSVTFPSCTQILRTVWIEEMAQRSYCTKFQSREGQVTTLCFVILFSTSRKKLCIIYLLTYSMVQSPSWEADWFAASQIPRISRKPKVHYRTHKRPPPVSILGQPNSVHIPTSRLLEIHPNIIHPSTPMSSQDLTGVRKSINCLVGMCDRKLSSAHCV